MGNISRETATMNENLVLDKLSFSFVMLKVADCTVLTTISKTSMIGRETCF